MNKPNRKNSSFNDSHIRNHRHSPSSFWDMDFKGNWEMGKDLIKDFFLKQKSISKRECRTSNDIISESKEKRKSNSLEKDDEIENYTMYSPDVQVEYEGKFAPEHNHQALVGRRLYQREKSEINNATTRMQLDEIPNNLIDYALETDKFMSKFNDEIQALWENDNATNSSEMSTWSNPSFQTWYSVMDEYDPFKRSLRDFWISNLKSNNETVFYSTNELIENIDQFRIEKPYDATLKVENTHPQSRSCDIATFSKDFVSTENFNEGTLKNDFTSLEVDEFYLNIWNFEKQKGEAENSNADKTSHRFFRNPSPKWSEGINVTPSLQLEYHSQDYKTIDNCYYNFREAESPNYFLSDVSERSVWGNNNDKLFESKQWPSEEIANLIRLYDTIPLFAASDMLNDTQKPTDTLENPKKISLPNHSETSSCFVDYSLLKSKLDSEKIDKDRISTVSTSLPLKSFKAVTDENLLTSERTHFYPIKAYTDGHTFDISNDLDTIHYKRSESGYMYVGDKKYLEYNKNDIFMTDEEASTLNLNTATTPLYANSNCEAAVARKKLNNNNFNEFVIKFRIQSCEAACQTEDDINMVHGGSFNLNEVPFQSFLFMLSDNFPAIVKNDKSNAPAFDSNLALVNTSGILKKVVSNDDRSFWTLNSVKSFVSKDNDNDVNGNQVKLQSRNCSTNLTEEIWSMREIEKKCHSKKSNMNNINDKENNNQVYNKELHALWGMCSVCNNEFKSAPANNSLRDELNLEADEIMSDLRQMQDLYIGRSDSESSELSGRNTTSKVCKEQCSKQENKNGIDVIDIFAKGKLCENVQPHLDENNSPSTPFLVNNLKETHQDQNEFEKAMIEQYEQQHVQNKFLVKMNRIIADLLCPEKAMNNETNFLADVASTQRQFSGSLWVNDAERDIWKPNIQITHDGKSDYQNKLKRKSVDKKDLSEVEQTWHHEKLAQIWGNENPLNFFNDTTLEEPFNNTEDHTIILPEHYSFDDNANFEIYESFDKVTSTPGVANMFQKAGNMHVKSMKKENYISSSKIITKFESRKCIDIHKKEIFDKLSAEKNIHPIGINRKRRHSSSLNGGVVVSPIFSTYITTNNNRNSMPIKMSSSNIISLVSQSVDLKDLQDFNTKNNMQQRLFACKYWTEMSSLVFTKENAYETENSNHELQKVSMVSRSINNRKAEVVKRVALISRPLTR